MKRKKQSTDTPAEAILVTWGRDMINEKGGLLAFIRFFESVMMDDESFWMHKSRGKPQQDILYVYVIVCNRVRYRCFYGGYRTGEAMAHNGNAQSWSSSQWISWPRIILAGPYVKAPQKIAMKGFQGFRYCSKLF